MTDFRRAIEAGLRSAEAADAATNEIATILRDLSSDVEAASKGEVALRTESNPWEGLVKFAKPDADGLPRSIALQSRTEPQRQFQVATFSVAPEGYPVVVNAFGNTYSAGDAEGLRHIFEAIFERSEVGRHMLSLMSRQRGAGRTVDDTDT
jgi:hypothetical protein